MKASKAIAAGGFKEEILAYEIESSMPDLISGAIKHKKKMADTDEGPRADSTLESLAKLRAVFAAKGSVTAGNSSQMSDGAGAVLLMSEKALKKYNVQPIARFVSFAVAGVPPEIMGIGPIKAIPKVLSQAGIKADDLDWIELNEAFAAQALAVIKDLGLNADKINPQGGAIALGHPLGATGAIRAATLLHGMRRNKQKWGMVSMCIGTGMGAAGLFEAL
jgi:acetyl-CoA acyltransferase